MKKLYVTWQDKVSRRWYPVGILMHEDNGFEFVYTEGVREAISESNFQPLPSFPNIGSCYKSTELFPLFSNRVISANRPDYAEFITWLGLDKQAVEPFAILARTGGEKATDNLQVFPCPQKTSDNQYSIQFFAHGIRHIPGAIERVEQLKEGDSLALSPEPDNLVDSYALRLVSDSSVIGYIPRYLAPDVHELLNSTDVHTAVVRVNLPPAPVQFRLLCEIDAKWPQEFVPFNKPEFAPAVASMPTKTDPNTEKTSA